MPTNPPTVAARRVGKCLVIWCPYCGEQHTHGGGAGPGDGDGHRVSHCVDRRAGDIGYVLVEEEAD